MSSSSSIPSKSELEEAFRLVKLIPTVERTFHRWAQTLADSAGGGTPARMHLLGLLNCKGQQMMSSLADELKVSPRQVTNLVDALESENLVKRCSHPTDRRATIVELTPNGASLAEEFFEPFHAMLAQPYLELPSEDRQALGRILKQLLDGIQQRIDSGATVPGS